MKCEVIKQTVYNFTFTESEAQYLADLVQNNLIGEPEPVEISEFRRKLFESIRPQPTLRTPHAL